jgi:SagB-type dehydrogenase family enzyme
MTATGDPRFAGTGVDLRPALYVCGREGVAMDDPAEAYHEASRLDPETAAAAMGPGMELLHAAPVVDETAKAARPRGAGSVVDLPPPRPLDATLDAVLARRRSCRAYGDRPLPLASLATLLRAAYGADDGWPPRRPVPSGGALYPLELFCVVTAVDGLSPGAWHLDPLHARLRALDRTVTPVDVVSLVAEDWPAAAPVLVVVAAALWRSRFKYGARAYRFTVLEAGHVAQNLLLAAESLALAAAPVGGFWDRRLDAALGLDGVNEVALYVVAVGHQP